MRSVWLACALALPVASPAWADQPSPEGVPTEAPEPLEPPPPEEPAAPDPDVLPEARPDLDRPTLKHSFRRKEIVVEVPGERSRTNKLALAATLGVGVIAGSLGVYYHLDSRDAVGQVSATKFTGRIWTQERQALVERAEDARGKAAIAYGIGGVFVIGAVVGFIVTEPKSSREVLRPHVALGAGGAVVGGAWSW